MRFGGLPFLVFLERSARIFEFNGGDRGGTVISRDAVVDTNMMIAVHAKGVPLTKPLREHVRTRLGFALGRWSSRVRRVDVTLSHINRPRGVVGKRCLLKVQVPGAHDIVIEDSQADIRAAIDRAASRTGRTLARRLAGDSLFAPQAAPTDLE